jgi:hypothetical protein
VQSNKEPGRLDRWIARTARYLREWPARHGRTVHDQMIRGVSSGIGTGAVSLLILWIQARN